MKKQTYYDILEVGRDASDSTIKVTFRRLATLYHPDKVKHLSETAQRQTEDKMKAITEAFNILRTPEKRKLYDRCLKEGLDFTLEFSRARSETDEDRQKREQKKENRQYMYQAAERVLRENIKLLDEQAQWTEDTSDPFFNFLLSGQGSGNRYRIHVKLYEKLTPADVDEIIKFAECMRAESSSLLVRDHFSFVLVTPKYIDDLTIREKIKKFNSALTSAGRTKPRRGIVLIRMQRAKPFVPFSENLKPPFAELNIKLM